MAERAQCSTRAQRAFRTIRRSLVVLLLLQTIAAAQETEALSRRPTGYLETPRATVRAFFEAMTAYNAGDTDALGPALDCLYLGEELTREERLNSGVQPAQRLFDILDRVQFSLDDLPESPAGDDVDFTVGSGEKTVDLRLHRYDDGRWRFSSTNLETGHLEKLAEKVISEVDTTATAVNFDPLLDSPRSTMRLFLTSMRSDDPAQRLESLQALDLRFLGDVPGHVLEEEGLNLAAALKGVMDRYKYIELNELPPVSEGKPYVLLQDPVGNIIIDVVTEDRDGREIRSWRFTATTLKAVPDLWDKYSDRPLVKELADLDEDLPLALEVRKRVKELDSPRLLEAPFYLENWQWAGLFAIIVFGMITSRVLGLLLVVFIRILSRRSHVSVQRDLERNFVRPIRISLMSWFWLLGLALLALPPNVFAYLRLAAIVVTILGVVWAAYRLIDIIGHFLAERAKRTNNRFDDLLVPILTRTLKVFVVVVAVVVTASESGTDITALVTGLGLGGLAFALAAKDVVANFFGSLTIILDRPFELGDWVTIGDVDGSVEQVGIRSTRIRTFYNSQITVPNSEIVNTSIDNMGRRRYRRIKTTLSVTYDTPTEKIEGFCEGIRELIRRHPYTRKDYFHVYFNDYSAHGLDILLYCFVETPDWGTELRERHRLLADILRLAERLGVEFAFPTQTLYVRQDASPAGGQRRTPAEGRKEGREAAQQIVRELLGNSPVVPPPVQFDTVTDDTMVAGFEEEEDDGEH